MLYKDFITIALKSEGLCAFKVCKHHADQLAMVSKCRYYKLCGFKEGEDRKHGNNYLL